MIVLTVLTTGAIPVEETTGMLGLTMIHGTGIHREFR